MTFARDTDTDFLSVSPPIWRIQLKKGENHARKWITLSPW